MDNQTIQLLVNIKSIFAESDSTYGKRRIREELQVLLPIFDNQFVKIDSGVMMYRDFSLTCKQ